MKDTQNELIGREESRLYYGNVSKSRKGLVDIVASSNPEYRLTVERVKPDELDKIRNKTVEYIEHCKTYGNIPTMQGLAGWLGVTRKTLYDWLRDGRKPQTVELLEKIRDMIVDISTQAAVTGKINTVAWIFYAKNYFEMQDSVELNVGIPSSPLDPQKDEAQLRQLYSANDVDD